MNPRIALSIGVLAACGLSPLRAQTLQYNNANPGWLASTAWTANPAGTPVVYGSWIDGRIAQFAPSSALSLSVGGTVSVAGLTNLNASTVSFSNGSVTDVINFNGGTINGNFIFGARTSVLGAFEVTGGTVNMSSGGSFAAIQSATVSGGTLNIQQTPRVSSSSDFHVKGGDLIVQFNTPTTIQAMGDMTVDGGTFTLGRVNSNEFTSASVTSLQGTGGTITTRANGTSVANHLVINQASNTEFSGSINGANSSSRLMLTKSGTGSLTLSGTISNLERTTTISAGTILVNSQNTSFGDGVGSTAIQVDNGAKLGGTGTISTLAGDHIVLANGARLIAGLAGTADRTTYHLGLGSALNLSGVTSSTEWLSFDLGSKAVAGTTYDQILLTAGTLNIGSGLLNFDDFSFNLLSGFGAGTYTLFQTTGITGTLGSSLSGSLNGFDALLSQNGNAIQLTVVPEPGVVWSMLAGAGVLAFIRRNRR